MRAPIGTYGPRTFGRRLAGPLRPLPDFLLIGTMKGGTSSLYRYLAAHPDVRKSSRKEIHYFDLNYWRGLSWYRTHFPIVLPHRREFTLVGEASPYYMYRPHVATRVRATLPHAKLVVLLRDPVERTYSHYRHEVRNGRETLDFEAALDAEAARLGDAQRVLEADPDVYIPAHHRQAYVHRSEYATQLEPWFQAFPRGRIHVEFSERLFSETAAVYGEVLTFLGARQWAPDHFEPFNTGGRKDPIAPATRARLRAHFAPHNARLEALLGRPLPWP